MHGGYAGACADGRGMYRALDDRDTLEGSSH